MARPLFTAFAASLFVVACGDSGEAAKKPADTKPATRVATSQSAPEPDDLRFKPTVRFRAQGRYEGPALIAYKQPQGSGEITDTIGLEFTVNLDKGELTGPVNITNGTTEVKRVFSFRKECAAPVLTGRYEFFTGEKAAMLNEAMLQIDGTQDHADMQVNSLCPGSMALTPVPAMAAPALVYLVLYDPRVVKLGYAKDAVMGADGRSYSMYLKDGSGKPTDNWRWDMAFEVISYPK